MTAAVAPSPVAASREYVEISRVNGWAMYEAVFVDENGRTCTEWLVWSPDGVAVSHVYGIDMRKARRAWEAASASDKWRVPDDAGQKRWANLEPPGPDTEDGKWEWED